MSDLDTVFIEAQRAKGFPDRAIADMGGWCLSDVEALPRSGEFTPVPRPPPVILPPAPLEAMEIPEVVEILAHLCERDGITIADILGPSKLPEIVAVRHEAMAVTWELNRFNGRQLGEIFRKDVGTITYGLRRHYERLSMERDWS